MIANGATFSRDKEGIIPRMVKSLFAERKRNKNEQLNLERELERIKQELHSRGL